jgi:hypothetical protein
VAYEYFSFALAVEQCDEKSQVGELQEKQSREKEGRELARLFGKEALAHGSAMSTVS